MRFSDCPIMVKISVMSSQPQLHNPQPIVSEWAEQTITSNAYAYLQRNP